MTWSNDPEMQKMFIDEVTERSERLVEGAQALRAGAVSPQEAGDLLREGHTIKGTGRVMGYDDVGSAGLMLEMIWRWIQQGEIAPTPLFGRVLEALSAAIPSGLDDPVELAQAMAAVHELLDGQVLPEALPPVPKVDAAALALSPDEAFDAQPLAEPGGGQPQIASGNVQISDVAAGGVTEDEDRATVEVHEADTAEPAPSDFVEGRAIEERLASVDDAHAGLTSGVVMAGEAEAEPQPTSAPGGLASVEGDSPEQQAPEADRSAHETFADLRRSMLQQEATTGTPTEPEARSDNANTEDAERLDTTRAGVGAGEALDDGLPSAVTTSSQTIADEAGREAKNALTMDPDGGDNDAAPRDESIGDLLDFPISEGAGVGADFRDDSIAIPATDDGSGVVALPSTRRLAPRPSMDPEDLGGLVRAVQTWAAEGSITVNAGRLYELVNHIVTMRMDLEAVQDELAEFAAVAVADPFFSDRVLSIARGISPVSSASEVIEAKALSLAAAPLRDITNTLPQLVRYLSRKTHKDVTVEVVGDGILVDRQVLEHLGDAVRQLIVNAVVHGIEDVDTRLGGRKSGTGSIRIEATQSDVNLEVSVVDDGRGIDWRAIREKGLSLGLIDASVELAPDALRSLLYQRGFTTRTSADELAGDGDGLAVVREAMESLNGSLRVESTPGEETRITLVVPIHQAMQKALLVKTAGITWGIPETGIIEVVEMNRATIAVADHTTVLERVDGAVPFATFADLMGLSSDAVPVSIVVATSAAGPIALGVEEVVGVRRVAAKELGAVLDDAQTEGLTGAALLGGEQVVLLVDPTRLAERQREVTIEGPAFPSARILIVDDSVGVQQVVSSALATSGFSTLVAASVADALGSLNSGFVDAVVVDFSMPRADGVALAHMIRQRHGDLPIVMLSGVAEGDDVERAREAGVDAFFNKADFREGGLAEKLRELIATRREREQTA